jgi:PAS domain S-box-containing protein
MNIFRLDFNGPAEAALEPEARTRMIEAAVSSVRRNETSAILLSPGHAAAIPDLLAAFSACGITTPTIVITTRQDVALEIAEGTPDPSFSRVSSALLQQAPFGMALLDSSGRVLKMNAAMRRWFGEERVPEFSALIFEDDREVFLRKLKAGEGSDSGRVRARRSDGTLFPFGFRISVVDAEGTRLQVVFGRDLTELVSVDLRYRHVFESSFEAIVVEDGSTQQIVECNAAFERLVGRGREELKGGFLRDLLTEVPPTPAGDDLIEFETSLRGARDRFQTLAVRCGVIGFGKTVLRLSFLRDATEERLAQRRYEQVFLQAREPMIIADEERDVVIDANPAAGLLIGLDPSLLPGRNLSELLRHQNSTSERSGLPNATSHLLLSSGGEQIPVSVTGSELPLADRSLTLLALMDLRLASRIEELERSLALSQRMEALGRMAAGVAHDFNNKLMAALPWVEVLRRKLPHEEIVMRATDHIRQSIERAAGVTRQLLNFARPRPPQKSRFDLRALVREQTGILESALGSRIRLQASFAETECPAEVDEGQIAQILLNVILNARDAMPNGGDIELTVRTANQGERTRWNLAGSAWNLIVVHDHGKGMPRQMVDQVFNPFFTSKELGEGRGLGLSVVHRLVTQQGGMVFLDSAPGEGTIVELLFPALPAVADPQSHPTEERISASADYEASDTESKD